MNETIPRNKEHAICFCKECGQQLDYDAVLDNLMICPSCGIYMRMHAADRLQITVDTGSFVPLKPEAGTDLFSLQQKRAKKPDAVLCGTASIAGNPCAVFIMDSYYMTVSMRIPAAEQITRIFELAEAKNLPVIGIVTSGGVHAQESFFTCMQMAKVSGAVKRHSDRGGLYISVLTDPTTGSMIAGFAMQGDVIIAEPHARIGFTERKAFEQVTGEILPEHYLCSEFMLEHGFLDLIESRSRLRETLGKLLYLHRPKRKAHCE